jgi:hypothetical protein
MPKDAADIQHPAFLSPNIPGFQGILAKATGMKEKG